MYECGEPTGNEPASTAHYSWHWRNPKERGEPCPSALAGAALYKARLGDPDWEPTDAWLCGGMEQTRQDGPTTAHYQWHRYHDTDPCEAALLSAAWTEEEQRQGRSLPDWQPTKTDWECGTAEDRGEPNPSHHHWHWSNGTEPCPKSLAERAHYDAELAAGHPLPDWEPISVRAQHICGPVALPEDQPGQAMIWHHKRDGTLACGRAKAARSRYNRERRRRLAG